MRFYIYERSAPHNKAKCEFFEGTSDGAILQMYPVSARRWAEEVLDISPSALASSGAPVSSDAALSSRFDSTQLGTPPAVFG